MVVTAPGGWTGIRATGSDEGFCQLRSVIVGADAKKSQALTSQMLPPHLLSFVAQGIAATESKNEGLGKWRNGDGMGTKRCAGSFDVKVGVGIWCSLSRESEKNKNITVTCKKRL